MNRKPRRRPPVPAAPARSEELDDDGYAWNYYGRDALPEDDDPAPVRPRPRARRRRARDGETGAGR